MSTDRLYPKHPLVGVSALIHNGSRVLLIKRGKEPFKDHWSLPGGMIEVGETMQEAVERELMEETSIRARNLQHFETFDSIQRDGAGEVSSHFILTVFSGSYASGLLTKGDDAVEAAWLNIEELRDLLLTPGTLERAQRFLATL